MTCDFYSSFEDFINLINNAVKLSSNIKAILFDDITASYETLINGSLPRRYVY